MVLQKEPDDQLRRWVKSANRKIDDIVREMRKTVVGQDDAIRDILICLLSRGNILLEGAPGLAKTLMVKTMAAVMGGSFKRIQFTADLLPTDITGFEGYNPKEGFFVSRGPIFANFILADEINRAPPKVQSALIEAMQELQVTIGKKTFTLEAPFIVLATQNPIETRGTYPLPEAQLDRFLFKSMVNYPELEEERKIMERNISIYDFKEFKLNKICSMKDIINMQLMVKRVFLHEKIKDYIAQIVEATRVPDDYNIKLGRYLEWGASPRASINLYIAAKANALLHGRSFVVPQDVKDLAHNVLRHRLILSYDARIMNVTVEKIIDEILTKIRVP